MKSDVQSDRLRDNDEMILMCQPAYTSKTKIVMKPFIIHKQTKNDVLYHIEVFTGYYTKVLMFCPNKVRQMTYVKQV